jgi:hypothetical protein
LPATPALTRPDAVKLKRFLAPDLVFILGILRVLGVTRIDRRPIAFKDRHGMPEAGRSAEAGSIGPKAAQGKSLAVASEQIGPP